MADDTVAVKIVADASGVKPGTDAAKGEIQGLTPVLEGLSASFGSLAREIRAMMEKAAESVKPPSDGLAALKKRTDDLLNSLDPLRAAQQRYDAELANAKDLLDKGAIGTEHYAQVQTRARKELDEFTVAMKAGHAASGSYRAGMQQLGYNMNDAATMWSMNASLMQVFNSQIGQTIQAVQMMTTKTTGLLAVLGSPWLLIATSVAMVLGTLASKFFETGDEAAKATPKLDRYASAMARLAGIDAGSIADRARLAEITGKLALIERGINPEPSRKFQRGSGLGTLKAELEAEADSLRTAIALDDRAAKATSDAAEAKLAASKAATAARRDERRAETEAQRAAREATAAKIAGYQTELEAARGDVAERTRIANEAAAFIKSKFGAESKEYEQAQRQIIQIAREAAEQRKQLETEIIRHQEILQQQDVDAAEADARFRLEMGQITKLQMLQQERQFEQQRFEIQRGAMVREQALVDPKRDPVRYKQAGDRIIELERQHQNRLTQIDRQATLQRTQIARQGITSLSRSWAQAIGRMVTLQAGFASTIKSMWAGILNVISGAITQVIEQWIARQITAFLLKRGWMAADGVASVTSSAGQAGAAAYASTAAIPIIGPALAPGAAASAVAATMAFAPMASAAGGWWHVPTDTTTRIHTDEMVLPAWAAKPLRSMIAGGIGNDNAPRPASGGNVGGGDHFTIHATDAASFRRMLMDHAPAVGAAVRKHVRNGGKTTL